MKKEERKGDKEKGDKEKGKTKIEIDRDLANRLKSMQKVGETYSDKIRELLEDAGKGEE